jgi:hypothetical protein
VEQGRREDPLASRTKEYAVEAGREVARRLEVEHTIHPSDGTIGEKNSYGNDPNPPRDSG